MSALEELAPAIENQKFVLTVLSAQCSLQRPSSTTKLSVRTRDIASRLRDTRRLMASIEYVGKSVPDRHSFSRFRSVADVAY